MKEASPWDCETILTTKSNISNHPAKINIERLRKTKKQLNRIVEDDEEFSCEEDESDCDVNSDVMEMPDIPQGPRNKQESKDEKKARKQAVKEARRLCRKMKKENTAAFKNEEANLRRKKITSTTGDVKQGARVFAL